MAERAKTNKAISQVLAPQPTSLPITPAPEPTPHTSWQSDFAAQQTRAPRAVLAKLPPPKAQLVRLPQWRVGEQRPVTIPYEVEPGDVTAFEVNEHLVPLGLVRHTSCSI